MYLDAMVGPHRDDAELVGLLEPNPGRLAAHVKALTEAGLDVTSVVKGHPDDLEKVIAETRADRVIITSPDFTHADLIVRSLDAGADVVVEKPLTIDPESTRRIAEAVSRTGRQVVVTHNYRYSPRNSGLKELIKNGSIGTPLSVTFEWVLDTSHGADYFRRWHRDKTKSGGLLIHKAAHHFDLINWLLADAPTQVYARGGVRFYGAENADARGMPNRSERGTHDGPHTPWELDLRKDARLKALYLDNESYDGYRRDQDVFGPGITTEDNLAVIVDYESGAHAQLRAERTLPVGGLPDLCQRHRGPRRARGDRARRGADRRGGQYRARPECPTRVDEPDRRRATDPATPLGVRPGHQDREGRGWSRRR